MDNGFSVFILGLIFLGAMAIAHVEGKISVAKDCEVTGTFRVQDQSYACEKQP